MSFHKFAGVAAVALAGLVYLSPSPAVASIVNISGVTSGEQTGSSGACATCDGALISPVQVTLGPGVYSITDAWNPTTGLAPGALYDAWNFEAGNSNAWVWHWKVLSDDGSAGSTINASNYASHILADVDNTQIFSSEAAAANLGYTTAAQTISLASTTTLDFVVNDYYGADNAGGVSLNIADLSAVPLPGSLPLFGTAVVALAALARRRSKNVV